MVQRPYSGGRRAARCAMGTPGARGSSKRGSSRWPAGRGAGCVRAGRRGRARSRVTLVSFRPVHVGACADSDSHAWTHAAAFVQHVHFGHLWRRSSSQAGAAAPVSGSKNRSRHAPQDCPCDCVHPRTRVDAGAALESFSVSTPPLGVRRTRFL